MHQVLHWLALRVRERVRSSMCPGLQSYPALITSKGRARGHTRPNAPAAADRCQLSADFVKAQLIRLPTSRDQAFTPLRYVVTTAALAILWFEIFWRYCAEEPALEKSSGGGGLGPTLLVG